MSKKMIMFSAVVAIILVSLVGLAVASQLNTASASTSNSTGSYAITNCDPANCPVMSTQTDGSAAPSSCATCPMMSGGSGGCPMMTGR
jgi:hypothetical protein